MGEGTQQRQRSEQLERVGQSKCHQAHCVCEGVVIEVRILSSQRSWETGALSLLITFQKTGSQVLEEDISEL